MMLNLVSFWQAFWQIEGQTRRTGVFKYLVPAKVVFILRAGHNIIITYQGKALQINHPIGIGQTYSLSGATSLCLSFHPVGTSIALPQVTYPFSLQGYMGISVPQKIHIQPVSA